MALLEVLSGLGLRIFGGPVPSADLSTHTSSTRALSSRRKFVTCSVMLFLTQALSLPMKTHMVPAFSSSLRRRGGRFAVPHLFSQSLTFSPFLQGWDLLRLLGRSCPTLRLRSGSEESTASCSREERLPLHHGRQQPSTIPFLVRSSATSSQDHVLVVFLE